MGCAKTHSSKLGRNLRAGVNKDQFTLALPKGGKGWGSLAVLGALFTEDAEKLSMQELCRTARWPLDEGLKCHLSPCFSTHLSEGGCCASLCMHDVLVTEPVQGAAVPVPPPCMHPA